jgi:GTP-dependent phosphoenolpyruvate carboxykinase
MNNHIDQISSEQHHHIDNQQNENSTQNDTKSKEIATGIKQIKKSPMTPTPLYVYFFSFSIQHSNISLENIHGGQRIQLKQLLEHLFCSQLQQ